MTLRIRDADPYKLLEVVLILGLIGMGIVLYLRPAAQRLISPPWWHWIALAILFFSAAGLHTWRRRRHERTRMQMALKDVRTEAARPGEGPSLSGSASVD